MESSNCAACPAANASEWNPWQQAFDRIYNSSIANDISLPAGKNRLHKFKEKIVELWNAMELAVNEGRQSTAHPLYSMAMKQLEVYQSVSVTHVRKRGRPKKNTSLLYSPHPTTPNSNTAWTTPTTAASLPQATTDAPPNLAATPNLLLQQQQQQQHQQAVLTTIKQSFTRLEQLLQPNAAASSKLLPSPLQELWQLKLRSSVEEIHQVEPYYNDALGQYLSSINMQIRSTATPDLLPNILKALDQLRSSPHNQAQAQSIQFAYKSCLQKYLQLVNPNLHRQLVAKKRRTMEPPVAAAAAEAPVAAAAEGKEKEEQKEDV